MKKIMLAGLTVEITMLIIILVLVVLGQSIPDFISYIFFGGMITCIISSFLVVRKKDGQSEEDSNSSDRVRHYILIGIFALLLIITFILTKISL